MCFMNAILQPLVHCVPFYNLFKRMREEVPSNLKIKTPLVDALIEFLNQFPEIPANEAVLEKTFSEDDAFEPEYVYDALRSLKKISSIKGRQEDAEEFLGFLLDGVHEELLLSKTPFNYSTTYQGTVHHGETRQNGHTPARTNGTDTWMEVGPKNKTLVTRRTEILESPITQVFGGRMRSIIKRSASKDSVMLEPFQSLPLDIAPDNVHHIEDALHNLIQPEHLDGIANSNGAGLVQATKQNLFEHLPPVLILHLKRFVYNSVGGTQKIRKHVAYSPILKIKPELLSPPSRSKTHTLQYSLFAVVYHHGKHAAGGHYTCDVHRHSEEWLHINDANIIPITVDDVTDEHPERQAYMLFFARS
ncbi:hypothetical protein HDU97_006035 [Phlyctochytrium planicorne]|nr:hypothetical protein HDU97_006035 [Phlyctochytrium planicorne]